MTGWLIMKVTVCELFCSGLSDDLTGRTCLETCFMVREMACRMITSAKPYHRDALCYAMATSVYDIGLCVAQEIRDVCTVDQCIVKHASVHPGSPAVPTLCRAKLQMLLTSNLHDSAIVRHLLSVSTHLRYLDLQRCAAQEVTATLQRLHLLRTLRLVQCNGLTYLPPLVSLTALNTLDLWECSSLADLPGEIGQLTGLSSLDLEACSNLVALPSEIGQLTGLSSLSGAGASQPCPPKSVS
jgi:hypothetical protein